MELKQGRWRIISKTERDQETGAPLYWSNRNGWVGKADSDRFTDAETRSYNLPIGGRWERMRRGTLWKQRHERKGA